MPTPQSNLLAYLAAGGTLTAYNTETTTYRDIPQAEIDGNATTRAVLVRWADAIVANHPAAPNLIALLTAYHTYRSINPGDPRFAGAMPGLQGAGLITTSELAVFTDMGTVRDSQRARDGWPAPVTDADVFAAKRAQLADAIDAPYLLVLSLDPAANGQLGAALKSVGLFPMASDYGAWFDQQRSLANTLRNVRIDLFASHPDFVGDLAGLDGLGG